MNGCGCRYIIVMPLSKIYIYTVQHISLFFQLMGHRVLWHVYSNGETVNSICYAHFHENYKINLISGTTWKSHHPTALHSVCEDWVTWFLCLLIWYWPAQKLYSSVSKESMWWNEKKKTPLPNYHLSILFSQSINIHKIFIRWLTQNGSLNFIIYVIMLQPIVTLSKACFLPSLMKWLSEEALQYSHQI